MSRNVDYPERPISEQLVDLHIYIVPPDLWRDHLNSAINQIINDTVSAGFIRVLPESSIYQLREELEQQLGDEILPREFVFLKSVGRCLTRIRPKQEFQLKVKNFLPPLAYVPEIFILEASQEYLSSYPSSGIPSGRNSQIDTSRGGVGEFNPHKPVPPIRNSNHTGSVWNGTSSTAGTQTENDEQEKRKAADRIRGQGQSGKPMRRSHASGRVDGTPGSGAVNGSTDGQQGDASKRKDLQELERRRRQVLEEEARNQLEETERLDEDRRKWADGTLQEEEEEENGRRGSAETGDSPHDDVSAESQEVERLLEQRDQPSSQSDDPVDVTDLKNRLTEELEKERAERLEIERRREELVKRAKALQNKTQQRRTHARDIWKKKYFDEKKKTNPLEEQTQRLRQELESLHRRIMSQLEGTKDGGRRSEGQPSMQSNLKIQATRMQHEIEDLQRRVENVKMKLTSEMKLRNQAETELRALRAELTQKKISMTINRNKTVNAAGTGAVDMTPRTPVPTQR